MCNWPFSSYHLCNVLHSVVSELIFCPLGLSKLKCCVLKTWHDIISQEEEMWFICRISYLHYPEKLNKTSEICINFFHSEMEKIGMGKTTVQDFWVAIWVTWRLVSFVCELTSFVFFYSHMEELLIWKTQESFLWLKVEIFLICLVLLER